MHFLKILSAAVISPELESALIIYFSLISLAAIIVTVYDKKAAKNNPKHRVREGNLLLISAVGGSLAMIVTMLIIRHKTKHIKFMLGIPLIIMAQAALITFICLKL